MENFIFKSSNSIRGNTAKRWLRLLSFFMMLCIGQIGFAQSVATQTFSASGLDINSPQLIILPSNITVNMGQPIQSVKILDFTYQDGWGGDPSYGICDADGEYFYYAFNLSVMGGVANGHTVTEGCDDDFTNLIVTGFTNLTFTLVDTDDYEDGDAVDFEVVLEVTYETPSCPPPTNLSLNTSSPFTNVSATWTGNDSATAYEYAITTSATAPASGTTTTNTSASASVTPGSTVYLHIRTVCGFSTSAWVTSSPKFVGNTYCSVTADNNDATGITGVTFAGINQTSTSNGVYTDYTSLVTNELTPGLQYPITVKVNTAGSYRVDIIAWIDWNNNGLFDDANGTYDLDNITGVTNSAPATHPKMISIPANVPQGTYRMRIRAGYNADPTACGLHNYSEAEDYTILVGPPPACAPVSNPTLQTSTPFTTANISWTASVSNPMGYEYAVTTSATAPESGTLTEATSGSVSVTAGQTYYLHVRAKCGENEFSDWITSSAVYMGLIYCTPAAPTSGCSGDNVASVVLGTLNDTGQTCTPVYQDQSASQNAIPTLHAALSIPMSVGVGSGGTEYVGVWIDYNQNGIFEASEFTSLGSGNGVVINGNISIPMNATVGITKMRVRSKWNGALAGGDACSAVSYGSTRDYNVEILPPPTCLPPTTLTATNITTNSANLGWASAGNNFDIKWGTSGFNFATEGTLVTGQTNPYSLGGLSPATAYQFYVRLNCGEGDLSQWAGPFSFVTACTIPDAPTTITFSSVSTTATTINWVAPDNAPTAYVVFRSTSNIPPVLVNSTSYVTNQSTAIASLTTEGRTYFCVYNGTGTSGTATSLTANTQYYYYVYSRNGQNSCSGAPWYSLTALSGSQITNPAAPTAFTSTPSYTSATVGWTAPAGGSAGTYTYSIEVATDSGYINQIAGSPFSTTSNSYNLTTLAQGTFYYVRITANNGIINSATLTGNFTTLIPGQIGTGTSAAALFPIRSGSNFSYTQQIYTKAQIEERLEENQNYITSIRFYYNGNGTSATPGTAITTTNIQNWAIYLGNTSKNLFSNATDWVAVGNMEQVFSGNVTFPAPGNWMEIFLDTPFQWDGESNIVVAVDENSTGNVSTANFRTFASGANRGIGVTGTNNIDPTSPGTGTTPTGTIAQISFGAIETPECEPITGAIVSSITPYSANISWTGNDDYYILEYGVSGFTLGTGTLLGDTDNPTLLEGLIPETNYHVYVRQMCGSNESPWIGPITFTTAISCPAPTAGTTTQITGKSATLNWTSAEGNFIINWGTGTFNPGAGANTQAVSGTSFTFPNNLTGSTTYRWYVRRDCSGTNDGLSAWAGPYTFTTLIANDNFADALPVVCGQTYTGTTVGATNDQPNPAVFTVADTLSPNVWYSYTGTGQPQQINLSLCESGYDTAILVATGTAGNLTWIAGNDDSCGVSGHRSQVEFTSNGTTTYWIMVRGYGVTSTGAYELVVACTEACTPTTTNDECSTASTLTLGTPLVTGNQCATSSNVNYPTCSGGTQFSSHFDSWYSFNSGASGQVSVSIAVESGEVGFAVYSGSCGTTMTSIACMAPTATSNSTTVTVQPNTNYFVRAYSNSTATRGVFTLTVNSFCIPGEWTGTTNSTWTTASNWCGSVVPTTLSDILIKADRPNYPTISSNVTISSLTVQNGASLTVNSNTLTVGAINVATGGTMTVKSGATLWQDANTVNTGNVTIQRNVTLQHLDYTVWSSPVVGQALQAFSPNTLANRIRDYVANTWVAVPNVNANFTPGKGYMFRAPNVFDPEFYPNAYTWTGSFTGVPQTADEVVVPFTVAANHQSVGNPYPTSIAADAFFDENDPGFANNSGTDILGAIYIWMTDRSDIAATGGDAWALYNPITGGTNPGGGTPHNGIIPAGQGFLLRTRKPIAELPSVKFTTDMRIAATGTFYRNASPERHRLWLNLANQETVLNQTLVAYVEGATQGFDSSIDAEALSNNGTALYSLVDNNTNSFMIQGRALPFNDLDVVPMGFRAANAGTYTISLANFDGVFADGQDIFLVDALNQVTHNLKEANYTFVSEAGEFNSRFSVVYRQDALSVTNPDLNNNWVVYPKNGQFQIETLGFEMKQVILYDMLGRTVYQSKADGNNHLVDAINANQVLIVKVVTTDNVILTKKVNN